jgi:hypothetical protein
MKIVFLDFDGVVTAKNGTPGSYLTHRLDEYGATPACLKRVLKLVSKTQAKIVISSNWRKFDETGPGSFWTHPIFGNVPNPLPKFIPALGGAYLETLPPVRTVGKAAVVWNWLTARKGIDSFVVLDDMCRREGFCSVPEFFNRYVNTDPETGFTEKDLRAAETILSAIWAPAV